MKKKSLMLACLLLFSVLSMLTFSSCDDDTNSYLVVTVVDAETKIPISGVNISVAPEGGNIEAHEGTTDAMGKFQTDFIAPAIMTINAKLELPDQSTENTLAYRAAESSARLKEGQIVEVTVPLPSVVLFEPIK